MGQRHTWISAWIEEENAKTSKKWPQRNGWWDNFQCGYFNIHEKKQTIERCSVVWSLGRSVNMIKITQWNRWLKNSWALFKTNYESKCWRKWFKHISSGFERARTHTQPQWTLNLYRYIRLYDFVSIVEFGPHSARTTKPRYTKHWQTMAVSTFMHRMVVSEWERWFPCKLNSDDNFFDEISKAGVC